MLPVPTRRWLLPLCVAGVLWAFSFGSSAALASMWLNDHDHGKTLIGINTGTYYLGIALTANLVPFLMRRWGWGCTVLGMIASGVTVAWFPYGGSALGWLVVRGLNGVAAALSLIPLETYVNQSSNTEERARNFGFYAFSIALGMALGQVIGMALYAQFPYEAFWLGGLAAFAAAAIVAGWLPASGHAAQQIVKTPLAFLDNLFSFGSAWSQGFLEGGMVALLPLFLTRAARLSDDGAGWLMGILMIGVILFQVPVAWLADRCGRSRALLGCYAVALAGLVGLAMGTMTVLWLAAFLFLVGACSGAFYPLGLAILGERLPAGALPRAGAWYLAINCVGSLIGPVIAGGAAERFGWDAMFLTGVAAVVAVPLACTATRLLRRRGTPSALEAEHLEPAADTACILIDSMQTTRRAS